MTGDLRQELGASTIPDIPPFRMSTPEGWEVFEVTPETEKELVQRASRRMMQHHRPDIAAEVRAIASQSFRQLRAEQGFMIIMPGEMTPEALFIPTALHGTVRSSTQSYTLDQVVKTVAVRYGARPLDANKQIAAWRQPGTITMSGQEVTVTSTVYLIPIPGSKRQRALQFTAAIAHPKDRDEDDRLLEQWLDLIDAHVATFSWE